LKLRKRLERRKKSVLGLKKRNEKLKRLNRKDFALKQKQLLKPKEFVLRKKQLRKLGKRKRRDCVLKPKLKLKGSVSKKLLKRHGRKRKKDYAVKRRSVYNVKRKNAARQKRQKRRDLGSKQRQQKLNVYVLSKRQLKRHVKRKRKDNAVKRKKGSVRNKKLRLSRKD